MIQVRATSSVQVERKVDQRGHGAHVAWIPFGFSVLEPADTLSLGLGSWVCSPAFSMYQPARNVLVSSGTKNMRTLRL